MKGIEFTTTFHTGQNMMIQDFGNGVTAHADLCSGNVKIMDNEKVYRNYQNISLRRFDMVIIIAAKHAKEKEPQIIAAPSHTNL